ncbi:MAG TPA: hypothetical protein VL976_05135, partial [Xanthobacteraceae bacterium]|nr:hypothetical protein [Xanthobacteraceae bacterium]
ALAAPQAEVSVCTVCVRDRHRGGLMKRREVWRKVLEREVQRWRAVPAAELEAAVRGNRAYEVEFEAKSYQVEIEVLENTDRAIRVMVAVDDGSLRASILPSTDDFIVNKPG